MNLRPASWSVSEVNTLGIEKPAVSQTLPLIGNRPASWVGIVKLKFDYQKGNPLDNYIDNHYHPVGNFEFMLIMKKNSQ